jgi:methionyl-tRNA formyltransferase
MSLPLKIIFAGTPDFASHALAALLDTKHQIIAVYTQPDRPSGRGRKLKSSPVKQLAEQHNIPVYQPASLKQQEDIEQLEHLQPDVMVVAAYGLLLPVRVLEIPRLGCLNIHASLLPRWRGAAPIQRAILAGDDETGITIMQMDKGLDTGDMLLKKSCPILAADTAETLHNRLAELGAAAIVAAVEQLETLVAEQQDDNLATYAKKLSKEEAEIDWQQDSIHIERLIRAFNPQPIAHTSIDDKTLRIRYAESIGSNSNADPGSVINCTKNGIDVTCGAGALRLLNLQPPGKKAMDVAAFFNGYPDMLKVGTILGEK